MVHLLNGEIVQADDPRLLKAQASARRHKLWQSHKYKVMFITLSILLFFVTTSKDDSLRKGLVPADERPWNQHWNYISEWDSFTRDMTSHETFWVKLKSGFNRILFGVGEYSSLSNEAAEKKSDGGGRGVPKPQDGTDTNTFAVTRCSSTSYAVTAYYCGLDIANNANANAKVSLAHLASQREGVASLRQYITQWHDNTKQRKKDKDSSVSVIRLGVGQNERSEPALEHVWNIICQPDGTFLVYMSYISFYSLHEWMTHIGGSLTILDMQQRLNQLEYVTKPQETWNQKMNDYYHDLFWVDVNKIVNNEVVPWKASVNTLKLSWNVACPSEFDLNSKEMKKIQKMFDHLFAGEEADGDKLDNLFNDVEDTDTKEVEEEEEDDAWNEL